MSATYRYTVPGYDDVFILVNSDWTGDAEVFWKVQGEGKSTVLPAALLKGLIAGEVKRIAEDPEAE